MGTPLLVMIFLVVYPFGQMIQCENKLLLGMIAMIIYNSTYIANAYETAAAVVTNEQYTLMEVYQFKMFQFNLMSEAANYVVKKYNELEK